MIQQIIVNGLIQGHIYALMALGFVIIYKTVKIFNFAHGVIYASGAYLAFAVIVYYNVNPLLGFIFAIIFSAIIGLIINRLVYFKLRKNKASSLVFMIASFGVYIIIQNILQIVFGAQILTMRTGPVKQGHRIIDTVITDTQIIIIVSSIIVYLLIWLIINKTKLGKSIRAVADDPMGARVTGINSEKIITAVFAIGSAVAGAAGILISLETNIEPTMGFNAILKGIIASIIGGIGSIRGALLGGLFLGLAENFGIWRIQPGWKDALAFGILILFLIFRPSGIMNVKPEKEKI